MPRTAKKPKFQASAARSELLKRDAAVAEPLPEPEPQRLSDPEAETEDQLRSALRTLRDASGRFAEASAALATAREEVRAARDERDKAEGIYLQLSGELLLAEETLPLFAAGKRSKGNGKAKPDLAVKPAKLPGWLADKPISVLDLSPASADSLTERQIFTVGQLFAFEGRSDALRKAGGLLPGEEYVVLRHLEAFLEANTDSRKPMVRGKHALAARDHP